LKIVILDAATWGADIDVTPLTSLGEATVYPSTTPIEARERLIDAEVVVVNKIRMSAETLSFAKQLRLICVSATGYDNIDLTYCRLHGIAICNVPAYCTDSVAQVTLSMALALATHLFAYRGFVHSGAYTRSGVANRLVPVFHELAGKTWGVVGGGSIGTRVAELATALGCRVLLCRRQREERYEQAELEPLLAASDIVSLHVPLSPSTRGMLDSRRIGMMKDGAILINVARGAVTDEAAVAAAVLSGKLGGLGVDVYDGEPFRAEHPFSRIVHLENVCLTPHMAWGAAEARARCIDTIARNIRAFYEGNGQNRII